MSVKCKIGTRPEQQVGGPEVEQLLEEAPGGTGDQYIHPEVKASKVEEVKD